MTNEEFERREGELLALYREDKITPEEHIARLRALKIERGAVIYVAMNEDGDYEVGTTADEAGDRLADNCGGYMTRIVRLAVKMAPPAVEDGPTIEVPASAGTVEVEAA